MSSSKNAEDDFKVEYVAFASSPIYHGECIPRIAISSAKVASTKRPEETNDQVQIRPFLMEDMSRVMDYENIPEPLPPDAAMGHLEFDVEDDNTKRLQDGYATSYPGGSNNVSEKRDLTAPKFPQRYCLLRGGFIFYFDLDDVQPAFRPGLPPTFSGPPRGVIPLERTVVEFPPGGRRVFREHATTDAKNGYELVIRHILRSGTGVTDDTAVANGAPKRRAPAYLVADSLGQRDAWAKAIRIRADIYKKSTKLRPAGTATKQDSFSLSVDRAADSSQHRAMWDAEDNLSLPSVRYKKITFGRNLTVFTGMMQPEERAELEIALEQFARDNFNDEEWIQEFFETRSNFDAPNMCVTLEKWQGSIKKGLRGAVLEQYEYFVDASRELSAMGREVARIHHLVKDHVNSVEVLMRMDLTSELNDSSISLRENELQDSKTEYDEDSFTHYLSDEDEPILMRKSPKFVIPKKSIPISTAYDLCHQDDFPSSIGDVVAGFGDLIEQIIAFIRECRYTEATDALLKLKGDLSDNICQEGKIIKNTNSNRQQLVLEAARRSVDNLSNQLELVLLEGLHRKTEYLRQIMKRERSALCPLIAPACLSDDVASLRLLVRLNKTQEASHAYTSRRSLSLQQCLNERPISSTMAKNSVDVIIHASQLSLSFFTCLSQAVEGFLDLFLTPSKSSMREDIDEMSTLTGTGFKVVPAEALSAVALWCDTELQKFSTEFGVKIFSTLTLAPVSNSPVGRVSGCMSKFELDSELSIMKKQLQSAEAVGDDESVKKLRKRISAYEQEDYEGQLTPKLYSQNTISDTDRQVAVEIAAKCIEQALEYSSAMLNSIGLPLTPRLMEYLRPSLIGCESDVVRFLDDKWLHMAYVWTLSPPLAGEFLSEPRRHSGGHTSATLPDRSITS